MCNSSINPTFMLAHKIKLRNNFNSTFYSRCKSLMQHLKANQVSNQNMSLVGGGGWADPGAVHNLILKLRYNCNRTLSQAAFIFIQM
jgi:hypothetical protein